MGVAAFLFWTLHSSLYPANLPTYSRLIHRVAIKKKNWCTKKEDWAQGIKFQREIEIL